MLKEKADLAEQQAQQDREARRRARRWTIGMAVLTLAAAFLAVDQWREAAAKTDEAAHLLVSANVYLAQAHEEKALALLKEAEDSRSSRDYQRVWMQALQAQRQQIRGREALHAKVRTRLPTASPNSKPVRRTFDIRPLFDPPKPGEDKLDQLLRWLDEQDLSTD